jgi:hypothetical protein
MHCSHRKFDVNQDHDQSNLGVNPGVYGGKDSVLAEWECLLCGKG